MKQVANVRLATWRDVDEVAKLSEKLLQALAQASHSDYFGGVDSDEAAESMMAPSALIVAEDERNDLVGFLLLLVTNEEQEHKYTEVFPEIYRKGQAIIVNGYGVHPNKTKGGIATAMLAFAKGYALTNGYTQFVGTIHPENVASEKSLKHISSKMEKAEPFIHRTRDGRNLPRQYFIQELA